MVFRHSAPGKINLRQARGRFDVAAIGGRTQIIDRARRIHAPGPTRNVTLAQHTECISFARSRGVLQELAAFLLIPVEPGQPVGGHQPEKRHRLRLTAIRGLSKQADTGLERVSAPQRDERHPAHQKHQSVGGIGTIEEINRFAIIAAAISLEGRCQLFTQRRRRGNFEILRIEADFVQSRGKREFAFVEARGRICPGRRSRRVLNPRDFSDALENAFQIWRSARTQKPQHDRADQRKFDKATETAARAPRVECHPRRAAIGSAKDRRLQSGMSCRSHDAVTRSPAGRHSLPRRPAAWIGCDGLGRRAIRDQPDARCTIRPTLAAASGRPIVSMLTFALVPLGKRDHIAHLSSAGIDGRGYLDAFARNQDAQGHRSAARPERDRDATATTVANRCDADRRAAERDRYGRPCLAQGHVLHQTTGLHRDLIAVGIHAVGKDRSNRGDAGRSRHLARPVISVPAATARHRRR